MRTLPSSLPPPPPSLPPSPPTLGQTVSYLWSLETTHRMPVVILLGLLTLCALCFAAFPAKGTQFVLAAVTGEVFYNPKSKGSHLMLDTDYEEKMQRAMVKKDVSKQTVHQNTLAFDREERDRREKSKKNVFGGASSSKQFML